MRHRGLAGRAARQSFTVATVATLAMAWAVGMLAGCRAGGSGSPADPVQLRQASMDVLADVLENTPRPVVDSTMTPGARQSALLMQYQLQAQALEILGEFPEIVLGRWLTRALDSPSDGVKYGTLLALGRMASHDNGRLVRPHLARIRELAGDDNEYLQLGGGYALYQATGRAEVVRDLPRLLALRGQNEKEEELVSRLRAETVFVLSLMPTLDPKPLIQAQSKDPSEGVQLMVACRLAVLGDEEAIAKVKGLARNRPWADDRIDALNALGDAPLSDLEPLRRALETDQQEEVRMAAARALGLHGDRSGLKAALANLKFRNTQELNPVDASKDPLHEYRVRFLAALALGTIGDYDAASGPLLEILQTSESKRFKLAAARAALELLNARSRPVGGAVNQPVNPPPLGGWE